jgi:hypothetical protein
LDEKQRVRMEGDGRIELLGRKTGFDNGLRLRDTQA